MFRATDDEILYLNNTEYSRMHGLSIEEMEYMQSVLNSGRSDISTVELPFPAEFREARDDKKQISPENLEALKVILSPEYHTAPQYDQDREVRFIAYVDNGLQFHEEWCNVKPMLEALISGSGDNLKELLSFLDNWTKRFHSVTPLYKLLYELQVFVNNTNVNLKFPQMIMKCIDFQRRNLYKNNNNYFISQQFSVFLICQMDVLFVISRLLYFDEGRLQLDKTSNAISIPGVAIQDLNREMIVPDNQYVPRAGYRRHLIYSAKSEKEQVKPVYKVEYIVSNIKSVFDAMAQFLPDPADQSRVSNVINELYIYIKKSKHFRQMNRGTTKSVLEQTRFRNIPDRAQDTLASFLSGSKTCVRNNIINGLNIASRQTRRL